MRVLYVSPMGTAQQAVDVLSHSLDNTAGRRGDRASVAYADFREAGAIEAPRPGAPERSTPGYQRDRLWLVDPKCPPRRSPTPGIRACR